MDGLTEANDIEGSSPEHYEDTDTVRVSIVLEGDSTLKAGFSTMEIADSDQAMAYRAALKQEQADMAAIEDAIILGCDSVNLSLGTAANGFGYSTVYEDIMDSLTESDTVVTMSGGNNGGWADYAVSGIPYLYGHDVSMFTGGSPGAYTNSLAVARAPRMSPWLPWKALWSMF